MGDGEAVPDSGLFHFSKVTIADMNENSKEDGPRRETLFEFIRRAFQDGAEAEPDSAEPEPKDPHVAPTGEEPKSKARLEDGACHADGQ